MTYFCAQCGGRRHPLSGRLCRRCYAPTLDQRVEQTQRMRDRLTAIFNRFLCHMAINARKIGMRAKWKRTAKGPVFSLAPIRQHKGRQKRP